MSNFKNIIANLVKEYANENAINHLAVSVVLDGRIISLNIESCSIDLKRNLIDTLQASLTKLKNDPWNKSTKIASVESMIESNANPEIKKLSFHPYHLDLCFTGKAFDLMLYLTTIMKNLDHFKGYFWNVYIGFNKTGFTVSEPTQANDIVAETTAVDAPDVGAVRLPIEQFIAENNLTVSPELLEHAVNIAMNQRGFCHESFFNAVLDKEWVTQRYIHGQLHKEAFYLAHSNEPYYSANFDDVPNVKSNKPLKVGVMVSFTNDFGVTFPNLEVVGFDKNPSYGRCVFLNTDSYWFAVKPESLTIQKGYLGISPDEISQISQDRINQFAGFDLLKLRNLHNQEQVA